MLGRRRCVSGKGKKLKVWMPMNGPMPDASVFFINCKDRKCNALNLLDTSEFVDRLVYKLYSHRAVSETIYCQPSPRSFIEERSLVSRLLNDTYSRFHQSYHRTFL